jgi:dCTP diphosphatase
MDLEHLAARLRVFARARDWEQFHTPKNLAMALSVETGELLELFQWLTADESHELAATPRGAQRAGEELADVLIYLVRLADVLGVDLDAAVEEKLRLNAEKYPVELASGNAVKASERGDA